MALKNQLCDGSISRPTHTWKALSPKTLPTFPSRQEPLQAIKNNNTSPIIPILFSVSVKIYFNMKER